MKCPRCITENPGAARCCMSCGTPLVPGAVGRTVAVRAPSEPNTRNTKIAGGVLAVLALAGLAYWYMGRSKVAQSMASPGVGTQIVGAYTTLEAPPPQEVIDYIAFLRRVETERIRLVEAQTGQMLRLSGNVNGAMNDNPVQAAQDFQRALQQWAWQWQQLGGMFRSYGKPIPPSCAALQDKYNTMLASTQDVILRVSNVVTSAQAGKSDEANAQLTNLKSTVSQDRDQDQSAFAADAELAAVCDKCRLHKDFDIKSKWGDQGMLGVGQ